MEIGGRVAVYMCWGWAGLWTQVNGSDISEATSMDAELRLI